MSKWKVYQDGCDYYYDDKTDWFVHWVTVKGKTFAIPMKSEQAARAIGNYVNHFGKYPPPLHASTEALEQAMFEEYCRCLLHLRVYGRAMHDFDEKRIESGPPLVWGKGKGRVFYLPEKGEPNSYRDLLEYENGPIRQRRFYGPDGYVEQDFDINHDNNHENHIFPHCHLRFRIKGKLRKSYEIPFHKPITQPTKYRKELYMEDDVIDEMEKWMNDHNVTTEYVDEIYDSGCKPTTVFEVQVRLALGWEFNACYETEEGDVDGFIYPFFGGWFCIDATYKGKKYHYETDDLDDFGENAMFGPFPLKEIVGELIF